MNVYTEVYQTQILNVQKARARVLFFLMPLQCVGYNGDIIILDCKTFVDHVMMCYGAECWCGA